MPKWLFILLLLLSLPLLHAQQRTIDSLRECLKTAKEDTNRADILNKLGWRLRTDSTCLQYLEQARELSEKLNYLNGLSTAHHHLGVYYRSIGDFKKSLEHLFTSLDIDLHAKNEHNQSRAYNGIAITYLTAGNFTKSLDFQLKALSIRTKLNDQQGISSSYNNLGSIYNHLGDPEKSFEYYKKSLDIPEAKNNRNDYAATLANMGSICADLKQFQKALEYYNQSLEMRKDISDLYGQASVITNIGSVYADEGDYAEALKYYKKSIVLKEEVSDMDGLTISYSNIAALYVKQDKCREALEYNKHALSISREIGLLEDIKDAELLQSQIYECMGDYANSMAAYKRFISVRDSIYNEENTKAMVRSEMNFEFEKKENEARLEQEKKDAIAAADAKRHRIILLTISGFGLLVLGFALYAYRSYRLKLKANAEITRQKELIEEKQKEILDSIHYAKRIQRALIASDVYISKTLQRMRKSG
jgi:tetratricopeptide (TPR) repeat protein